MNPAMKIIILGCGTSTGVPKIGGKWGVCDPDNPKNRRRRSSIYVEEQDTKIIIDTTPDLREQCLDANICRLDGVLYTHDHADHTHGIDDLRAISHIMKSRLDAYGDAKTMAVLKRRFEYIFESRNGYPAILNSHEITCDKFTIGSLPVQPFELIHGNMMTLGFRLNKMAYTTDLNAIPEKSERYLHGLDLWIVDALRPEPHATHSHLAQTLDWIEEFKPKRAILTHMTWDMDYETLKNTLPNHIEPAYDGMVIHI
ncbi:Metal-dependent hydrolases of the beta-lactamase superfamily I; PhnP protein [hydrothermal vent metagenome]|uniref:Metal-dependent hydrolases of the beta-lactamase superfamily I PhnP protein n=1 Tax=hydrothermal vent metagenome TaxID=652676 RepID=A0A3B1AQC5_9ZZZZ